MGFKTGPDYNRIAAMPYKLIVSDLDGTFLTDKTEIPEKNIEAVRIINKKGVGFSFASGRSYHSLDYFYNALSLKGQGVCGISFNGAVVYEVDTLNAISKTLMDNATMLKLLNIMRPLLKDIYVYGYDGMLYSEHETTNYTGYATRSRVPYKIINNLEEVTGDIIKVLLIQEHEVLAKVHDTIKDFVPGRCNMFFSSKRMLEFTGLNATKGNALKFLSEYLKIDIKDIIAVGDNFNDESMVKEAGLGIVTANAVDSLKNCAGYVTNATNNDGAIMEIAEKFL